MIIVKLISGLGNQLFQYSFARRIALERKLPLKLDISFFDDQDLRAYKLHHFNIEAEVATQEEIERFLWKNQPKLIQKLLNKLAKLRPYYKRRYIKEERKFSYDSNMYKVSRNVYLDGYWQNYHYHQKFDHIIRKELTLKTPQHTAIKNILHKIESSKNPVSLHIRRGDYITDVKALKKFGPLKFEYYQEAIQILKEKVKDFTLFIFSDEIEWVQENIHFEFPTVYVNLQDPSLDYLELFLMSKCNHNIIANSTFSWWGAYLNNNTEKLVISPKEWSKLPEVNNIIEIQYPDWIQI